VCSPCLPALGGIGGEFKQKASSARLFKSMNFEKILEKIKDYIFPVYCLGCKKEGAWLCEKCLEKINMSGVFCCPVCHKKTSFGEYCFGCGRDLFLNSSFAITVYQEDGLIGKIIQTLKYSHAEDVSVVLKKMIKIFVQKNLSLFSNIDLVVPVPLHRKRLVERGFNQAKLIAEIVAQEINKPCQEILIRNRHTLQQAKLGREERLVNVKNAFDLIGEVNGNILLIDDVFTTGTTLQECAKVLKNNQTNRVIGFTVARG